MSSNASPTVSSEGVIELLFGTERIRVRITGVLYVLPLNF